MLKEWVAPLLILFLTAVIGCSDGESGTKKSGEDCDAPGRLAAVEPGHWGGERIVYAEDMDWIGEQEAPAGEEWAEPPDDRRYVKFTYHGPKLARLETFGPAGRRRPGLMVAVTNEYSYGENGLAVDRTLMRAVRTDWDYAAHGGVAEQRWYAADGESLVRLTCRYDDADRLVEEVLQDTEQVRERHTYRYDEQGRELEVVFLAPDGAVRTKFQYTYSEDGKERTEKMQVYEGGTLVAVGTFRALWDPVAEEWSTTGEEWQKVEQQ